MTSAVTTDGWSAYDDAVPHPTGLPQLVERAAHLRELRRPPDGATLADVRRVVVVVSSSRGGSTLFGQVLRRLPGLLHLRAEINPLFTLAGLHEEVERRRVLDEELLRDIGTPTGPGRLRPGERGRLVLDLVWRLTIQWPELAASHALEELVTVVDDVVPAAGSAYDPVAVQLDLLEGLRRRGAAVHPGYYDLPPSALEGQHLTAVAGPPAESIIEMPPFVTVDRWRAASAAQLESMPLVISTPRCSFRLEFIRDLFPSAELRVVHLTRNPAASVNGLVDGWRHQGFFNAKVPGGLAIDGYSDEVTGGTEWWCYDFPPGWEGWTSGALEDVCAFQWWATHVAAIEGCDRLGIRPLHVRFEEVLGPREGRLRLSAQLAEHLGVGAPALDDALVAELPVVMATAPPSPARWRRRLGALDDVVGDPPVLELAASLGYDRDPSGWV